VTKQTAGVWRAAYWAIALSAGLGACSDASTPNIPTGEVNGTVTDARSGQALESATITVGGRTAQVGPDGYTVADVPVGRQQISATLSGYVPFSDTVDVIADLVTTVHITLTSSTAVPLAPTGLTAVLGPVPGSVVLTWNPVEGATSYTIYTNGMKIPGVTSPYQQNGLSGGVARQYYVTATGAHGESAPSQPVSITPVNSITLIVVQPGCTAPECPPVLTVDSVFSLAVTATSQFSLESLVARVGTRTTPLSFVPANGRWEATISLAGLPHPSLQQLDLIARDVQGDSATLAYPVRYDKPPVVTLTLPQNGAVARPDLVLQATCQDDGPTGCVSLRYTVAGNTIASGTSSINQTVSLAAYDGQRLQMLVAGRDDAGQGARVGVVTYVELSPRLVPVASAGQGIILDADATRFLVADVNADFEVTVRSVRIVARVGGASTTILADTSQDLQVELETARLTSHGAILLSRGALYEWRDGAMVRPAGTGPVGGLEVEGDFAIWIQGSALVRRNLANGTNQTVTAAGRGSVAVNGNVAYVGTDENIRTYSAGTTTQLTTEGLNRGPVTDGTQVVFVRALASTGPFEITLFAPGSPVVLATVALNSGSAVPCCAPEPHQDYRISNGWIAFVEPDITGVGQVWIRSPGGTETQLSFFGVTNPFLNTSFLKALSTTGEVVFDVFEGRRYRAAAGISPVDIGSRNGRPLYIDGVLHVALGATLFVVN